MISQWERERTAEPMAQRQHQPDQNAARPGRWSLIALAEAIRLIRLEAPAVTHAGQPLRLRCLYETRGDRLQSLSWYRNGREFYRYQPFERRQPILAFNSTGLTVDITKSRNNTVYLTNTTTETSGRFRCEATGTTFQEAHLETYIEVSQGRSSDSHQTLSVSHTFMMLALAVYILGIGRMSSLVIV